MKYKDRDIKVFIESIDGLHSEHVLSLGEDLYRDMYAYNNFESLGYEKIDRPKNIFQEYNLETYKIYAKISKMLNDACQHYSINKERQRYFIKGKVFEYTEDNNNEIFDFPGRDIPVFHGFVILGSESLKQTYYTARDKQEYQLDQNMVTLSAPTNLINSKVNSSSMVIEYYLAPLSSIVQNEHNLWIPIL